MTPDAIVQRYEHLKGDRGNWDTLWQDCADHVIPRNNNVVRTRANGEQVTVDIYDNTAIEANEKFAAGLFAYLCPPTKQWFTLMPQDPELKRSEPVVQYFRQCTEILYQRIAGSNFHQQIHEHFLDLGWCGTGNLFSEEDPDNPGNLIFRNHHIKEYVIDEDCRGKVDSVFRSVPFTPRQAVQFFDREDDNLPDEVRKAAESTKPDRKFDFLHAVVPNDEHDSDKDGNKYKAFASVWIERESKTIIRQSGYDEMPYHVDRFEIGNGEMYGRSPASRCLPVIKLVNAQQKTLLKAGQMAVDPPTLLPDDGSISSWRNMPGALNYWNAANPNAKPEQMRFEGNLAIGAEMITDNQRVILETFNVDLFNALASAEDQNMTATEVVERVEEKLTLLTPFLGRLQRELFDPLVIRAFNILFRAGEFPDPPQELEDNADYEIEYGGKLALALKQMEVRAFQSTMAILAPVMDVDPGVFDNFDFDKITLGISRAHALPEEWIRDIEERDDIRAQRAQAQAAQAQMEMAGQAADAMNKGSKAPEAGSPAEQIIETGMA